jgi:hypothetical protein
VPLILKRQCDRTLGGCGQRGARRGAAGAVSDCHFIVQVYGSTTVYEASYHIQCMAIFSKATVGFVPRSCRGSTARRSSTAPTRPTRWDGHIIGREAGPAPAFYNIYTVSSHRNARASLTTSWANSSLLSSSLEWDQRSSHRNATVHGPASKAHCLP